MTPPRPPAVLLASIAWCAGGLGALVVVMGPLSVSALGLSISHPSRPLVAAVVLLCAAVAMRRGVLGLLVDLSRSPVPYVATLLLTCGLVSGLLVARGATNVGGADSAGYLLQARRWQQAALRQPVPLDVPGMTDPWVQSPLGTRPTADGAATVPTYPPGLPWLEAVVLATVGEAWAVRGLPLAAALAALLGLWALARPRVGAPGAAFVVATVASLPTFLFQALQPMSDVPALACWLVAIALSGRPTSAAIAGASLATAVAILVRPNLAPLALCVAWHAWLTSSPGGVTRWVRAAGVGGATAGAVAIVAAVQWRLYGSPMQSGYGSAADLFAWAHVAPNLSLYPGWLIESTGAATLAVMLAGLAWWALRGVRAPQARPPLAMAVLTIGLYLVYAPFDSWSYLRFLLVPLAILPVGAGALFGGATDQEHAPAWRFPVFCACVLLVTIPNLQHARRLSVFTVREREFRYQAAGDVVRTQVPASAVVVAAQHSASAAYYGQRPVVRADLLTPDAFRALATWARVHDRPLVFVLDEVEGVMLRERVGQAGLPALDWPPRVEIGRPVATRVWVAADQETYRAGGHVRTRRLTGR